MNGDNIQEKIFNNRCCNAVMIDVSRHDKI